MSSPFDPSGEFAEMRLLYPSAQDFRKSGAVSVTVGAALVILGLVVFLFLGFQNRLEIKLINPLLLLAGFLLLVTVARKMAVSLMPIAVFHDAASERLVFRGKKLFTEEKTYMKLADIGRVAVQISATGGNRPTRWKISVILTDGSSVALPDFNAEPFAKRAASNIAATAGVEMVFVDDKGVETAFSTAEEDFQPLINRLGNRRAPAWEESLQIKRDKSENGVTWNVSLPSWVTVTLFGFAFLNVFAGALIWFRLEKDTAVWASVPFFVTTFILFVITGMIKTFRRTLELSPKGIGFRGSLIPLDRLENIQLKYGRWKKLLLISPEETISLMVTERQGKWLKEDIEFEIRKLKKPA
jgi:hypothetical protein